MTLVLQSRPSETTRFLKALSRDKLGMAGLVIVATMVLSAVLADFLVPYDPIALNIQDRLQGPSWTHLLGTDQLGRDTFSRVLMGGQVALKVALPSIGLSVLFGLFLGMLSAIGPRWLDSLCVLLFDTVRSFPTVMFALAILALVGPSLETIVLVVIVTTIPVYARMARTQTMALWSSDFIAAERSMGASRARIMIVHLLPNIVGPLVILASMDIPGVIALEAGLSFLGMGVRPPTPSWGSILNEGYSLIRNTPWLVVAGGIPLILTTLGFTFLGEALRDIFDPKLRKER